MKWIPQSNFKNFKFSDVSLGNDSCSFFQKKLPVTKYIEQGNNTVLFKICNFTSVPVAKNLELCSDDHKTHCCRKLWFLKSIENNHLFLPMIPFPKVRISKYAIKGVLGRGLFFLKTNHTNISISRLDLLVSYFLFTTLANQRLEQISSRRNDLP